MRKRERGYHPTTEMMLSPEPHWSAAHAPTPPLPERVRLDQPGPFLCPLQPPAHNPGPPESAQPVLLASLVATGPAVGVPGTSRRASFIQQPAADAGVTVRSHLVVTGWRCAGGRVIDGAVDTAGLGDRRCQVTAKLRRSGRRCAMQRAARVRPRLCAEIYRIPEDATILARRFCWGGAPRQSAA